MNREVDVLIIGAGPAGLSAGIVFANQGLKTLVCEQKALPVDKVCGEGVMPTGLAHLKGLGVLKFLSPDQYYPFKGICYTSSKNLTAEGRFREGAGWGIPRIALSQAFVKRAKEFKNLEIIESTPAKPEALLKDRVIVSVGGELFFTRLLVGADGLSSKVRRWAGLDGTSRSAQRWGTRQHYSMAPWSDHVEIYWGEGVEAYITPCGKQTTGLTMLWDRHRYRNLKGGKRLIPSLLAAFPILEERFSRALPSDMPMSTGPMHRIAISPVGDGVVLLGDAAGYLDALTGEGISLATSQALALQKHILPLLLTNSRQAPLLNKNQLGVYRHAYQMIVRPYYRITRLALILNRYPLFAEWTIRILSRHPGLFQSILSAHMSTFTASSLQPALGRHLPGQ